TGLGGPAYPHRQQPGRVVRILQRAASAGGGGPRRVDESQIEGNTVVALTPSTGFGGIRVRDGTGVRVTHNTVLGPWANSLAPTDVASSVVAFNRLEGATFSGIRMSLNAGGL